MTPAPCAVCGDLRQRLQTASRGSHQWKVCRPCHRLLNDDGVGLLDLRSEYEDLRRHNALHAGGVAQWEDLAARTDVPLAMGHWTHAGHERCLDREERLVKAFLLLSTAA